MGDLLADWSSRRTATAGFVLLVVLSGCLGGQSTATPTPVPPGDLTQKWLSDTKRDIVGNHHAAEGVTVNGTPVVVAPISGHAATGDHHEGEEGGTAHEHDGARGCALVGLDGETGAVRWRYPIPPANCTIHSVADPVVGDLLGGPSPEVYAASTVEEVVGVEPVSGDVVFQHAITEYGYTRPVLADLDGDGETELAVVDIRGNAVAVQPDGTELWARELGGDVQAQPHGADLDADEAAELVVGLVTGEVVALDDDGTRRWSTSAADSSVLWLSTGQADGDAATETVVGTFDGRVVLLDDDGSRVWSRDVGTLAAVHAFGDGDGDAEAEIYAVDRNGTLRAMSAGDGETEWLTDVVPGRAQTTPPPVMGDLDGDGDPELALATNAGRVLVVDPATGDVLAAWKRDVPVWTHPTLADLDADDAGEIVVTYGDGRVAVLDYHPPD